MGCDEYQRLKLAHLYAARRVARYTNPSTDPLLSIPGANRQSLEGKAKDSRAEALELSSLLESHQRFCQECRAALRQMAG